jgi:hypothetical protein
MSKFYGSTTTTPINPIKFSGARALNVKVSDNILLLEQAETSFKAAIENNILIITEEINL